MADFNKGTLVLKLRDGRNNPLKDIVDIEVEHHTLTRRVVLRDVDTWKAGKKGPVLVVGEVRIPDLPATPQGLHRVYVDPDGYRSEAEFVNIEPDTITTLEIKFKKEGRDPSSAKVAIAVENDEINGFRTQHH